MQVQMRTSMSGIGFSLRPDDIYETSSAEGKRLIERGMAVAYTGREKAVAVQPKPEKRGADPKPAKKKKPAKKAPAKQPADPAADPKV